MSNKYVWTILTSAFCILIMFMSARIYAKKETKQTLKVGFIYNADTATAYTNNFSRTQTELEDYFGDRIKTYAKYNLGENEDECGQAIEYFIGQGCQLIFAVSYGHGPIMKKMAEKYPDVHFCHATGDLASTEPILPNYHAFMGRIHEGRYVCGIIAGMKIQELILQGKIKRSEVKIGYVGAFAYAEVISGFTAFFLGIRSIVPEAQMIVHYTNTWSNHIIEKKCAERLIDEGCVVISQHSDTMGPAIACEEASVKKGKTVFHVGYNQSMIDVAPTTSLVSCRINWTPYMMGAVEALLEGKSIEKVVKSPYRGTDAAAGFNRDWIEIIGINHLILAEGTMEAVDKVVNQFKSDGFTVFQGNYSGVNPFNPNDVWDLRNAYIECEKRSAPSFCYILRDVITSD